MFKSRRRWAAFALAALVLGAACCALMVYLVDPFEQYRESSILPLYDQESYNNPGIAKNYDYNAVILGTSMVEMSNPSVIDACFGVSSVKLPMRGSHTAQMGWQLEHVFRAKEKRGETLDLAILAVDAYSLMGPVDDDEEIVDYLWNDDLLDDIKYLLNRDVLLVKVPKMLKNAGKPMDTKRDDMYKWTDIVFAAQSVYDSIPVMAQKSITDPEYRIERSTENINRHIRAHALAHPETEFKIYMPPYSAGYWYVMGKEGLMEQQFRSRARVCELLLDLPNVEIYDFSSKAEWILDLDEYFDYSHHSSAVSDKVMRAMAAGECRVTSVEEMQAGSERIREAVAVFAPMYESR